MYAIRSYYVSFAADGKLYVGTGFDGTSGVRLNDFYAYNPPAAEGEDEWTSVAALDVEGREGVITSYSIHYTKLYEKICSREKRNEKK